MRDTISGEVITAINGEVAGDNRLAQLVFPLEELR